MKKPKIIGYAIYSEDLKSQYGSRIYGYLHECKSYYDWNNRGVIASVYRVRNVFSINFLFHKRFGFNIKCCRYENMIKLPFLNIRWEWMYINKPYEIVYREEDAK